MEWKTRKRYIDMQTGELISKQDALDKYIIIKKNKHAQANNTTGKGVIEYTIECRKREYYQNRLFK